jgi:hypothetical protein
MALSVKAGLVPAIHVTTPHHAAEASESQSLPPNAVAV